MIGFGLNIANRVMGGGGGGSAFDVDAQAFFDRVTTAGGTLSTTEKNATNQLVLDMKSAGIWSAMKAIYPMVGSSAAACAQNLRSASFTGSFSSGWTFSANGVQGNGSSAFFDTALNTLTNLTSTSAHLSIYVRNNSNGGGGSPYDLANATNAGMTIDPTYLIARYSSNLAYFGIADTNYTTSFPSLDSRGFWLGTTNGSRNQNLYKNGSYVYNSLGSGNFANNNLYLGSANGGGVPAFFSDKQYALCSVGDGLDATQQSNFYTAVQTFNQTLNRQVGAQIVSDADAQAYINRVYTAGGTLTNTEANAVNQLTIDMKAAGIWTAMKAVYPMVGSSAAACAQNLKSSSFTGTFSSGWTFASTGATPNGTSAYMDSNLNPNTVGISASSMHISNYLRTNSNGVFCDMGGYSGNPSDYQVSLYSRLTDICYNDLGAQSQTRQTYSNTDSIGYYINTRTANNVFKMFKSNTLKATNTATNTATILSTNIFLGANNQAGATQFSPRQNAFASIGDGLTDTQASDFYTCVQTFQTTLSRQV
jgi:hypothetical protein